MKKHSLVAVVVASLAISAPVAATADAKDALIGGIVGAIIQKGISDSKRQSAPQRKTYSKSSSSPKKKTYSAPSLNSQYSQTERVQIQSALQSLGYNVGAIDGVLGQNSRRVIGQFQAGRGEAATGQLTRAQYVALVSQVPGAVLVFAARELNSNEIRMLQEGLQRLGYYQGGIDGAKGPGTQGAMVAFLAQQGRNVGQTTPVQSLVLARSAAGLPTPPYLQQEAGAQQPFMAQQQQPFAAPNQQFQAGFGAPAQQPANPFAAPGQQPATGFGAPAPQQQPFGAPAGAQMATAPAAPLFGAPQPQQQQQPAGATLFGAPQHAAPQQGGTMPAQQPTNTNLFAPTAPQPQQQQPVAPQGGQATTLFAAGGAQMQPQVAAQPQSSLDIFGGTQAVAPQPIANPDQVATQMQPTQPADANGVGALFAAPNPAAPASGSN